MRIPARGTAGSARAWPRVEVALLPSCSTNWTDARRRVARRRRPGAATALPGRLRRGCRRRGEFRELTQTGLRRSAATATGRAGPSCRPAPAPSSSSTPRRPQRWLRSSTTCDWRWAPGSGVTEDDGPDGRPGPTRRPAAAAVPLADGRPGPLVSAAADGTEPAPVSSTPVLSIDRAIRDAIVAHARRDHPDEACGVIAGPAGSDRPTRFVPMLNAARSPTFYEFDSADLLRSTGDGRQRRGAGGHLPLAHRHRGLPVAHRHLLRVRAGRPLRAGLDPRRRTTTEFRSFRIIDGVVTEEPVEIV